VWSGLIVAGISRDPPTVVGLCKRRACEAITSHSFSIQNSGGSVLNKEDKQRGVSSGPKHAIGSRLQIEASSFFDYPADLLSK
jgi:hypothetical protein